MWKKRGSDFSYRSYLLKLLLIFEVDFSDFSNTFSMVSHGVLLGKMSSIQLYKPVTHWVDNWLMGWAQGYSKWGYIGLVASHQWGSTGSIVFINYLDTS